MLLLNIGKLEWSPFLRFFRLLAQAVEGFVLDVGWYRTTIRSFEREIYNIPNSVFSRNVVLNITRKENQWRFFEFVGECLGFVSGVCGTKATVMLVGKAEALHNLAGIKFALERHPDTRNAKERWKHQGMGEGRAAEHVDHAARLVHLLPTPSWLPGLYDENVSRSSSA